MGRYRYYKRRSYRSRNQDPSGLGAILGVIVLLVIAYQLFMALVEWVKNLFSKAMIATASLYADIKQGIMSSFLFTEKFWVVTGFTVGIIITASAIIGTMIWFWRHKKARAQLPVIRIKLDQIKSSFQSIICEFDDNSQNLRRSKLEKTKEDLKTLIEQAECLSNQSFKNQIASLTIEMRNAYSSADEKLDRINQHFFDQEKERAKEISFDNKGKHTSLKDTQQFQIYLKGENKTKNVKSFKKVQDKYEVIFNTGKRFLYNAYNVRIIKSALNDPKSKDCFHYLNKIADAIGLRVEVAKGKVVNILSNRYSKIGFIIPDSVLAAFLNGKLSKDNPYRAIDINDAIYPFGFNASQKQAVDSALSSQLSIIEGPPGTGKTQTILNVIANTVIRGESVAVVSSNNAAIANITEKLEKYKVDFIAATLGNTENKNNFINSQKPLPEMSEWYLLSTDILKLQDKMKKQSDVLEEKFSQQNQLSLFRQELSEIQTEEKHFLSYFEQIGFNDDRIITKKIKTSKKALQMWLLCESIVSFNYGRGLTKLFRRLLFFIKGFNRKRRIIKRLLAQYSSTILIASFQRHFYKLRISELTKDISTLKLRLNYFNFKSKMDEYSNNSSQLFRARLAKKYAHSDRITFELKDLQGNSELFIDQYPVILSTTYSLRNSLSKDTMYDYVIIDESSQVDLCTGALALSCARKTVVVGDLNQLSHVVDSKTADLTDHIFYQHDLPEVYRYKSHSLLSALITMFPNAPRTLLREHYRCHPKIINFCNKKFYDDQLIILTDDINDREPLMVYKTVEGNHERNRVNQRQIDIIKEEIIPQQNLNIEDGSLGIVTPYRNQTNALQKAFEDMEVKADTVDKFQGQECPVVILSTVDNQITGFTDNANRLNVAISRAVKQLIVVVNQDDSVKDTNIGDLIRYIEYNNFTVVQSKVHSVFDYLYKGYNERRLKFLTKHRRVSKFDSENLMNVLLSEILKEKRFRSLKVATHVPLRMIVNDLELMDLREREYATHPNTHVDFLIFDTIGKSPRLVIEVDGVAFHQDGSRQAERDAIKNTICNKYDLPILRLKTDGSHEDQQIISMLDTIMGNKTV